MNKVYLMVVISNFKWKEVKVFKLIVVILKWIFTLI